MFSKIVVAKAIAALSFLTVSATGAAAATGSLPGSVQDGLANAAEHVGVKLPHSDKANDKADKADKADAEDKGVERVTENCVAAADGTFARNRGQYLQQERAKSEAAFEAAKKTRCGMPVDSNGTPGADDASETPDTPEGSDPGKSGKDHGKSGDDQGAPAVQTPNSGGIGTGETASDGANATGKSHANPKAEKGSGNADDHPTKDDHPAGRP